MQGVHRNSLGFQIKELIDKICALGCVSLGLISSRGPGSLARATPRFLAAIPVDFVDRLFHSMYNPNEIFGDAAQTNRLLLRSRQ